MLRRLRNIFIIIALALAFVAGERLYTNWRKGSLSSAWKSPITYEWARVSSVAKDSTSLTDYMKPPRLGRSELLVPTERAQAEAVEPACLDFMAEAQRLNMEMFTFPPKLQPLPRSAACEAMPEELAALKKTYEDGCGKYIGHEGAIQPASNDEWMQDSLQCQVALWQLRGGVTAWRNRDVPLSEIDDLEVLADHLAFAFSKVMVEKPDGRQLVRVSERILELNPHVYAAAKTALLGTLFEAFEDKTQWDSEVYRDRVEWLLERAERINPDGRDLEALRTTIATQGMKPELVQAWAQAQLREDGGNAQALNALGYAQWRLGQRQAALATLRQAAELAPNDHEIQRNWHAAQRPGAKAEDVQMRLTVGLNLGAALQ